MIVFRILRSLWALLLPAADPLDAALRDGTIGIDELWAVIRETHEGFGLLWSIERRRLERLVTRHRNQFDPQALEVLLRFLAHAPHSQPLSIPHLFAPAPRELRLTLAAEDVASLKEQTNLPLVVGNQVLRTADFAEASFAEPDRRESPAGPVRRYPLRLADFVKPQPLRFGESGTGVDGVLEAAELRASIRSMQNLARAQLVYEFNLAQPVPLAGLLLMTTHLFGLFRVYALHPFPALVANAVTPVDNDGMPKNSAWLGFAAAYQLHQRAGAPSIERLQSMWFRSHLDDFAIVDTPEGIAAARDFWESAIFDQAFALLAVYTQAMMPGRKIFEQAMAEGLTDEAALFRAIGYFVDTFAENRTAVLSMRLLAAIGVVLIDPRLLSEEELDDRRLPTTRALLQRTKDGIEQIIGGLSMLRRLLEQARERGLVRKRVPKMVELANVLSPTELTGVHADVIAFYRNPTEFDVHVGVELSLLGEFMLSGLGVAITGEGDIPDRKRGFEKYPVEQELYRGEDDRTHWDRSVVVDGHQRTLFHARFEPRGGRIIETFETRVGQIELAFRVHAAAEGIRLDLDRDASSELPLLIELTFETMPVATGLETTGTFKAPGTGVTGTLRFEIARRAPREVEMPVVAARAREATA